MAVTTDGLVYEWVGKFADDDNNAPGSGTTWYGNVGDLDITLAASGLAWVGDGSAGDPYALHADGTSVARSNTATGAIWQDVSFTVELWMMVENTSTSGTGTYFGNTGATGYGFRIAQNASSTALQYPWGSNGSSFTTYTIAAVVGYSTWHHVLITYDGTGSPASGTLVDYIDNSANSRGTVGYYPNTTLEVSPFFSKATGHYAHGSIATVRWYSKALSAGEVDNNYAAGVLAASTDTEPVWTGLTVTKLLQG